MSFSTAHALLIGIGSYANISQLNVPITAADANAIASVLRDPQFCGYPEEHVKVLSDDAASREGLLAAFNELAARSGADDTVLVFYAGHGDYGDDGYYLTTHDTLLANRKVVSGSGLSEDELIEKLRAIKAKRLLFIINACHSGEISPVLALDENPLTGTPVPPQVSAALLSTGEGRVIISACRQNQYAFIGPGSLTLFTQALVDGMQGKGVNSNRGYISIFDLYTHVYFALDEAVPRLIPAAVRQRYGEKQEPELTILKGVGPFAIALWRGATTLGTFDASSSPPEGTAVREINPAYSQIMLRQHQQTISGQARVGAAVAGDVYGDVNVMPQSNAANNSGGDNVQVGDITGSSGIAIGHKARSSVRNVNTGGGDYAEGSINKGRDSFVHGEQFNRFGNFSGTMFNIKTMLANVSQSINTAPTGDASAKAQLRALIEQLSDDLQKAPVEKAGDAEAVAEMAKQAIEQATKERPNKTLVQISVEGLKQAAQNLAAAWPTVLPLAQQIVDVLRKVSGV